MFQRVKKILLFLRIKREVNKMDSAVRAAIISILDGALTACEGIAKLTPSAKDDSLVAMIRGWREMVRPVFGAEESDA